MAWLRTVSLVSDPGCMALHALEGTVLTGALKCTHSVVLKEHRRVPSLFALTFIPCRLPYLPAALRPLPAST